MEEPLGVNGAYYRQNVMGFAGYNYDNRYMLDVVANYGTSVLLEGDKFRFYPAVSAGWNIANEAFLEDVSQLDMLKLRASWGRSATDGWITVWETIFGSVTKQAVNMLLVNPWVLSLMVCGNSSCLCTDWSWRLPTNTI